MILRRTWLIVALVSACCGCVQTGAVSRTAATVKLDGSCLELDDGVKPTPEQLLRKIDEDLKSNRRRRAILTCERFPDVVLQCESLPASRDTCEFVRLCSQRKAYEVESAFLKTAEAERKAGHDQAASLAWSAAATKTFDLPPDVPWTTVNGPFRRPDPAIAERVIRERPPEAAWPNRLGEHLTHWILEDQVLASTTTVPTETVVWLTIGHLRLERGEPKSALAAAKKAETADPAGVWREWTQLQQAKALMQLGQSPSAVTILTGLAETASPPCRLAALATLGACKFRDGHVQQSLIFLKKAVEESKVAFPGRAEAEADLGLAYLSTGDEAAGLDHLHAAQKSFAEDYRSPSLWLALENEVSYLRHVGRTEDANRVEARLRDEQSH
jgi:tetratricopeptide (TPR) repeat protein